METRYAANKVLMPAIEELLNLGQSVKITITGNSMLPLLRHEMDQVELCTFNDMLCKGTVVLILRESGEYVLHRVIKVDNVSKQFYMIGDAQRDFEGPLRYDQIVAVASALQRGTKRIDVQNPFYKLFVWFWFKLIKFRPRILSILRKLRIIP